MAYKIAVVTSDGVRIDGHFGSATNFQIVSVADDGSYQLTERRLVQIPQNSDASPVTGAGRDICGTGDCGSSRQDGCGGSGNGCGSGSGGGCGGGHSDPRMEAKIAVIEDCRAVLCAKCGPGAERQLQRKAITPFAIEMTIEEALSKIVPYYQKLDGHISLRKQDKK